jgi:hypothetical protein
MYWFRRNRFKKEGSWVAMNGRLFGRPTYDDHRQYDEGNDYEPGQVLPPRELS